jgi:LPS sulfotransferase NodH
MSGLIVCATQRSGSTLLCELLKATVLALLPPLDPGVPEAAFDFDAARRAGTTSNGVFSAKIM